MVLRLRTAQDHAEDSSVDIDSLVTNYYYFGQNVEQNSSILHLCIARVKESNYIVIHPTKQHIKETKCRSSRTNLLSAMVSTLLIMWWRFKYLRGIYGVVPQSGHLKSNFPRFGSTARGKIVL